MVRKVMRNSQVAHVWAAQSQAEGRSANGQFYFSGAAIYSYRPSWPLASFLPIEHEGKRVVVLNEESYSMTTRRHLTRTWQALHGRDDVQVIADRSSLAAYTDGWGLETDRRYALGKAIVSRHVAELKATAERSARPQYNQYGACDNEAYRIDALSDADIVASVALFGIRADDVPAYDIAAMRETIRAAYRAYNSPAKAKARERRASLASLKVLAQGVQRFEDEASSDTSARAHASLNLQTADAVERALREHPRKALPLIARAQVALALREIELTQNVANPEAAAVRFSRRVTRKGVTPAQWQDGAKGHLEYHSITMVRRKGDVLETSRGAEVPFAHAVRIFALAQDCRAKGEEWASPPNHAMRVGAFELNRISREGDITVGCHQIAFDEMLRLALREAPHVVKARYPLPVLVTA